MATFKVPITWSVWGEYEIEADTLEEAIEAAEEATRPLPKESWYIADSAEVDGEQARKM